MEILPSVYSIWSYTTTSTLPTFFLTFILLYLISYLFITPSWGPKFRPFATSCLISLAHGAPATIMAIHAIHHQQHHSFASPNTDPQTTVLEFSTAYFLVDLLHYLVFYPHDVLFIIHHVATLFVFLTCLYVVRHGAYGILGILILAEITSPCQNTWSLARTRRDVQFADSYYRFVSPGFYGFYSVVRGILGPTFVYSMVAFYTNESGSGSIPTWAWMSWIVVIVSGILGSLFWVFNHWKQLFRERSSRQVMEKKER